MEEVLSAEENALADAHGGAQTSTHTGIRRHSEAPGNFVQN